MQHGKINRAPQNLLVFRLIVNDGAVLRFIKVKGKKIAIKTTPYS